MTSYLGRKFKIHGIRRTSPLAEGTIGDRLGTQDGLEYYEATVTILFTRKPREAPAQVAIRDLGELEHFYLKTKGAGRMKDFTSQLEWLSIPSGDTDANN
jgi:hypothetical protein